MGSIDNLKDKINYNITITMHTMWIILLILQLTTAYNIQKRSRALEVEGSGMNEDNMMLEIEDMKEEENGGYFLESLFAYFSEILESLNFQSLIPHSLPTFAAAVPRSLIDIGDIYDLQFVIESVRQFGLIVKDLASHLSTTSILFYSSAALLSVVLIGWLFAISMPILGILYVTSGLANFRTYERDGYILDGIRTARGLLGEDFDAEVLDQITAGVLKAVDTYSMLQGLQEDFLE